MAIESFENSLREGGMTFTENKAVDMNKKMALYFKGSQEVSGHIFSAQVLLFGDDEVTQVVTSIYPTDSKGLDVIIKASLFSIIYNSKQGKNQLSAATFSLDAGSSDLKLASKTATNWVYTNDGILPTDPKLMAEQTILMVTSTIAAVSINDQKQFVLNRFEEFLTKEFIGTKEIEKIAIDNLNGYELKALGNAPNLPPVLIYCVILFDARGDYYMIFGYGRDNAEKNLEQLKKIAHTFKRINE